ncbi:MAG: hypothetical protein HYY65_07015 [Candidatus Tectomicrobia bacterium]|uniref:Uncharacterized protein n=1 Tax=Tectimicrobiota bacterium TaxID=2528274 RepID=A0A932M0E8_UNCTE|nr:hypothetical protein [Candidatus Tectomicrobia bacterium]
MTRATGKASTSSHAVRRNQSSAICSSLAGSEEGQNMDPEEFQDLIWQIGRTPAQRSTTYEILKRFPAPSASRPAAVEMQ